MEISGTVIDVLPVVSGEGRNGVWRKQEFIIETPSQYPKKVCISIWGDRIDQAAMQKGETVTASIDLESREYNGRWYTEARAWKVEKSGATQGGSQASDSSTAPPLAPPLTNGDDDELPF